MHGDQQATLASLCEGHKWALTLARLSKALFASLGNPSLHPTLRAWRIVLLWGG